MWKFVRRRHAAHNAQRGEAGYNEGEQLASEAHGKYRLAFAVEFDSSLSPALFLFYIFLTMLSLLLPLPFFRPPLLHAQARMAKKLTQKQLAQALNEQASVIQKYEQGKQVPTNAELAKMEKILGTKLPRIKKKSSGNKNELEAGEAHPSIRVRSSGLS